MRLVINFTGVDLVIIFSGMSEILNNPDHIVLTGDITIAVNDFIICKSHSPLVLMKRDVLAAASVYFEPLMEVINYGKNSTSDL